MSEDQTASPLCHQDDTLPPQLSPQTREVKKRRSYTIDQKLEVVQFAKTTSRNAASRKFNIARHCVSQWMKSEEELIELLQASTSEMPAKRRRPGAGRHVKNEDLDDQVADWVHSELAENRQILRSQIQDKALDIYQQNTFVGFGGREFKASTGWLEKFLLRHNFQSSREGGVYEAGASTSDSKSSLSFLSQKTQQFAANRLQQVAANRKNLVATRKNQLINHQNQQNFESKSQDSPKNVATNPQNTATTRNHPQKEEEDLNEFEDELRHMSSNDFLHKIIEEVNQEMDGNISSYIKEEVL